MIEAVTWTALFAVAGLFVTTAVALCGAVWCVAKIASAGDSLKEAIQRLTVSVDQLDKRLDDHNIRIDRLENRHVQ